ncbi:MAG: M56 family metallopeptidase [Defluviitaleaceae bacterium]|nr:M56 family metallopeptidase [Defluviitaleaceae bacterium]
MSFFETFLFMSLTGSVMILAVMFIRPLLKKWRTHGVLLLLWFAACALLLTPFRFTSPISVYYAMGNLAIFPDASGQPVTAGQYVAPIYGEYQHIFANTYEPTQVLTILFWIWLVGAILALIYAAVSAILLHTRFRDAVSRTDLDKYIGRTAVVYVSSYASGPLTYGIFRPRIILPLSVDEMDDNAIEYMLLHELQHIHNRDALINLIWILALALHWFNPLVWLGWINLRRDIETKIDADVVKLIGAEQRTGYAQTLLNMVPIQRTVFPLAFGSSSAKDRIKGILAYRPATKRAVFTSLAMMIFFMALFAANPEHIVRGETTLTITTTVMASDYAGIHLFRVETTPNAGNRNTQSSAYIHSGSFYAFSEVQDYFITNYLIEVEAVQQNIGPESAYTIDYAFAHSGGFAFNWQGLSISVTTETATVYYMLMDASTFNSEDIDINRAVNELTIGIWTTGIRQADSNHITFGG